MTARRRWIVATVAVAGIAAMGLSIRNGFVYDDVPAITQNPRVTDPALWHTIPAAPYWLGTLWRPVTIAGFAAQWWLGHGAPWLFHLVSLVMYLAIGALLFAVMRRLGIGELAAAGATILFLVHPVHVEVVANIVGQSELWVAIALLAAALIYLDARLRQATTRAVVGLIAVAIIAMGSKEQGFVLVPLLLGAEWTLALDRRPGVVARLLVPVTMVSVLLFLFRTSVLLSATGEVPAAAFGGQGIGGRSLTFLAILLRYVRLIAWPVHLQAEYGPPGVPIGGPFRVEHLVGIALVLLWIAGFARAKRSAPVVAFGLLWIAMTLAPISNVLTPTGVVMAERLLFLPSIGLAMVVGGVLDRLVATRPADRQTVFRTLVAVLAAWGAGLAVRSALRVPTWQDEADFHAALTVDAPDAYRAWRTAGIYWEGAGKDSLAIADLTHAMKLWPHDPEVNDRLGQFLRADGRYAEAIPILESGLRLDPTGSLLRAKLIECLMAERRWDDAERIAREALDRGQGEFASELVRIRRLRAAADSSATTGSE
ncbi:MAG TPA: tetratricopeptide repeat protein [Gemmatimonadales bacterium]|jgi:hypothetical protein